MKTALVIFALILGLISIFQLSQATSKPVIVFVDRDECIKMNHVWLGHDKLCVPPPKERK